MEEGRRSRGESRDLPVNRSKRLLRGAYPHYPGLCPVNESGSGSSAPHGADELRVCEHASAPEANGIFCHLESSSGLPVTLPLFLSLPVPSCRSASAEGLDKPGKNN